jgi:hypothetical protein
VLVIFMIGSLKLLAQAGFKLQSSDLCLLSSWDYSCEAPHLLIMTFTDKHTTYFHHILPLCSPLPPPAGSTPSQLVPFSAHILLFSTQIPHMKENMGSSSF